MPVLPDFYISHQWLRELKRKGARTFIGVYFKLDSKTKVYAGKYNERHRQMELGAAIKEIMALPDPLGFELIVTEKVEPDEIRKIRVLPQKVGWRYFPSSHLKKPSCACPICIPPGSIKGRRLREKLEPPASKLSFQELLAGLMGTTDESEIDNLLMSVKSSRRRSDPNQLVFLLERKSDRVDQSLALTLQAFRHKNTSGILLKLLESGNDDTREFSAISLLDLYGKDAQMTLKNITDPIIQRVVEEWGNGI